MEKKFSLVTKIFFFVSLGVILGMIVSYVLEYTIHLPIGSLPILFAAASFVFSVVTIFLVIRDLVKVPHYSNTTKVFFTLFLVFLGAFLVVPCVVTILMLIDPFHEWFYIVPISLMIIFPGGGFSGIMLLIFWLIDKTGAIPRTSVDESSEMGKN